MAERIDDARPKVLRALRQLRRLAPRAQVFLVGYPVALPDDGVACYPQLPILQPDVTYLRDRFRQMNEMLAGAAATVGVHFVDTYSSSIGHDLCQPPGEAWVNGIAMDPNGIPAHPNGLSHRNTARVVADAVRAAG